MRGRIASRQVCPMCGARGRYQLVRGRGQSALVCQCGQWAADRLEIVLKWQGKTHRITHTQRGERLTSYPLAEAALVEINNQIKRGVFDPALWSSAKTNRLLWENYLRDWLKREKTRSTKATYMVRRSAARHLAWFNGMNLRDIRTGHVRDFLALPCLHLALKPNTIKGVAAVLRLIFQEAVEREEIERAPKIPKVVVPEQPIEWMLPEEQERALAAIPPQHRPIFQFLMLYGCRVGEACALCWDAIDRRKGVLYFKRTLSRSELKATTKTRRSRALPIFDAFAEYLDSIPPGIGETPVFQNPKACPSRNPRRFYTPLKLSLVWKQALKDAGLPHIHLKNATRHSRGMQAINLEGWDQSMAQVLLGHANPATTGRFYARPEVALLKRLVDGKRQTVNLLSTKNRKDRDSQLS